MAVTSKTLAALVAVAAAVVLVATVAYAVGNSAPQPTRLRPPSTPKASNCGSK